MESKLHLGRGAAVLACVASLAGAAVVAAPSAASARAVTKCANKSITVKPEAGGTLHIPVRAITTYGGGVTCAEAYKVIRGSLEGKVVNGWAVRLGNFKAPEGLVPEMAQKPGKKIQFAVHGG